MSARTATFPPIRVDPEVRASVEAVLREGESLTQFIEKAVVDEAAWHRTQLEFTVVVTTAALHDYARIEDFALDRELQSGSSCNSRFTNSRFSSSRSAISSNRISGTEPDRDGGIRGLGR